MSDISRETVKCAKCGKESQQLVVYSVNYSLGDKETNDKLVSHKQKCPYCGYEAISIDSLSDKLKREELVKITEEFINDFNKYEIFKIPNELYLDYFKKIEDKFNAYDFEEDSRFVTYGRLSFLKEELTQRLNDDKLRYEEPNSVWGKGKWDNRMGAFIDLWDYIRGDRYIAPHQVPEGKNFKDTLLANDQYYKDGLICKQERDILLEMIKEIRSFILNKFESNVYEYEFIPYKKIGDISLDKLNKQDFKPSGVPHLYENGFNHVLCEVIAIDHPDHIKRKKGNIDHVYIKYNNKKIELTCCFEKFVESLNQICDDIVIIEDNENINEKWKTVYSKKLGIIANANLFKDDKDYYIRSIRFTGKEVFDSIVTEIFNTQVPIMLQVSRKGIYTLEQTPWVDYLEIDEETGERKLQIDTPEEIKKQYSAFLKNNMVNYNEFIGNNNTYLVNIKKDDYIFISSNDTFSNNNINNCFVSLKENKIYNYTFDLNNKYEHYKDLTNNQKEKLIKYINDNDLLNISDSNQFNPVNIFIDIEIYGKKNQIRISDNEMYIFNDIIDIVLGDSNSNIKEINEIKNTIDSSNIEKKLMFKIEDHDWGLKTIYTWNTKIWYIYDDLSIKYEIINGQDKVKSYSHSISEEKLKLIIQNVELSKSDNRVVDACDGEAWEFIQYEDDNVVWERKLGYIYGIDSLETVSNILLDLVKNDSDIFSDEEMEENDMGLFSKKDKYDIDERDNRPQIVYGIPDSLRKQWEKEEKEKTKNNKYNIQPKDNMPREVYGIPDFIRNKDKYDIKPEDNVPQKVYGIPNNMTNSKYDINPENNVPQRVYGIPNISDINSRKCPYCGSIELWKYLYGEPTYDYDKNKYILGGCEITGNQPTHKCKKCGKDIYPDTNFKMPNNINMSKESIRIGIKNDNNNYVLLLNHVSKPEMYDLLFADLNNLDGKSISDLSTNVPERYYNQFVSKLYSIISNWTDAYSGESNVEWSIKLEIGNNTRLISGNGGFPSNWNEFIDLISEYEKIFKNKKKIDIEKIHDMEYDKLSFTEAINSKLKDPFWAELVIKYFKEEEKVNDFVGKLLFKDLSRYDDILNEFTKYLNQRTYDLKDAIEINGYTAKKIYELNPQFNPSGVYTFMELLRSDPTKAEEIIKGGFKNKDAIPPTNAFNGNNKSEEEMLKEIENEVDNEMVERGLLTIKDGRKIPAFGSIHVRWEIEKKLLKERYNYDWKTPAEKNPGIMYD